MKKSVHTTRGFTLIELLVVIAIIGLLSSVVLAALNGARVKARDAERQSDLHQIRVALELYYGANGHYPAVSGWLLSNNASWNTLATALAPYLPKLPTDPVNSGSSGPWVTGNYVYAYGYNTVSNPQKYDLVAQFENTGNEQRCQLRGWLYHTGGSERPWCPGFPNSYSYSPYLYADH